MQRITITLDDDLMSATDSFTERRGYRSRSEAIRDLTRAGIEQHNSPADAPTDCVAAVIYVFDHEARDLPKRLIRTFYDHQRLLLTTFHVHLDRKSCMEVTMLRGASDEIRNCAEHVTAERGVRHGRIVMVPLSERHKHGTDDLCPIQRPAV